MIEYQNCPSCGTEKIRTTVRVCSVCETTERYETQVATLQAELDAMTRYRDNASLRLKWAERERDEARYERDALHRALVRHRGGGSQEYAKTVARNARKRFLNKSTAGLIVPTPPIGGEK
jgi:uncharacterized Zn finger protein (UPF0148 family)